jgi:hypothetical protein
MRKRIVVGLAVGLLALASASSVAAHEGHGSCAGGAPGVIETIPGVPQGPGRGPSGPEFVAPTARAGQASATIAALHAVYCEPRP